jgi:putative ABC transport system permease protein
MQISPPKFPLQFLGWFCPPQLHESIEGDVIEKFEEDLVTAGVVTARRNVWFNVLRFFRPEIILRNKFSSNAINTIMLGNYFKVASRNIARKKLYSFINAFGLSIAIAFCVLIYLFIRDEKSFDKFHQDADRVFMITTRGFSRELLEKGEREPYSYSAYLPAKLSEVLQDEVPEVEASTRISEGDGIMTFEDKIFKQQTHYIDSGFFKVFSFRTLHGSVNRIFRNPNEAVMTKETAEKYFGNDDPLGKVFTFESAGREQFTVVALIETPPANSSIEFQMLLHVSKRPFFSRNRDSWGAFSYPTFVRLNPNATLTSFDTALKGITGKYMGEKLKQWRERENIPAEFMVADFTFCNITDVHLNTRIKWAKSSDPQYSYVLASIGFLILLIAAINYVSLALTTSASRRAEVGIRKVVGAQKSQLVYQFGFEAIILAMISMIFGIGLVVLFLPAFNEFTKKEIGLTLVTIGQLSFVALVIGLVIGIVAGSYPALYLSGFRPAIVLKGRFTSRLQAGFTKPLVILQFALSAFLIISALIMYNQMKFVTTMDLGYKKDQVLVISTNAGWNEESDRLVERFRNRVRSESGISGVAGTSSSFNQGWSRYGYRIKGVNKSSYVYRVDPYYAEVLNLKFLAGRNFDERIVSDTTAVIVNEALVKDMGWKDPLNEYLNWREDSLGPGSKVIGVLKDYHFLSLEEKIEPMFLSMDKKNVGYLTTILVSMERQDIPSNIERMKKVWSEISPDKPFEYSFMDEDVRRQYEKYERWMKIAGLSTGFAILIASLGLFGLAGINAFNKTREIGIRKVMGAGLMNIFVMLNRQYIWMAVLSFVIATPFSYYVMNKWISDFQFRIDIGWELFAISMVSGLFIALLTVSYHGFKAASINPAETLKYE